MNKHIHLYLKRDEYFTHFKTEISQRRAVLRGQGMSNKLSLKALKRSAWKILKEL